MKKNSIHRILTIFIAINCLPQAQAEPTLMENVHGYTMAGANLERFSGLVFDQGKVLATGNAAILRKQFSNAKIINGHGSTLLPGLIDAHGHVNELGFEATAISLGDTQNIQQAQNKIREYAKLNPLRIWILGSGWNQVKWQLGRFPVSTEIDVAESNRPVLLSRIDGHAVWLNTKAMQIAGINKETKDPFGGRIERDSMGNPSGVLVDAAMDLAYKMVPPPSDVDRHTALAAALAHINAVGLTSVGDAGVSANDVALYKEFSDKNRLSVRIYAMIMDTGDDFKLLSKEGPLLGYGNDRLTIRSVKLLSDGALGSRGAAMLTPYSDQPDQTGLLQMSDDLIEHKIETALKAGYQVNVHAIGDAANHQVLNAFETAYNSVGGKNLRNRIEHAQILTLPDIARFKELNLIASMQPTHATSDMNMAEDRIGKERLKGAYAWRTFLKQGTLIAGGSDFPIESDNPFYGIHAAVTRTDHAGLPRGGWHPEQAMTLKEAFRAFTIDAAYAQHQENFIGSLETGKWADFILIDRDLFKIRNKDIWKIKVKQTWVGGAEVY